MRDITLAGVQHWGHHENFPDAYNDLLSTMVTHSIADSVTFVLEEGDEVVAFYELADRGEHVELVRMFQRPALIGSGLGRLMWDHAADQASRLADRMLILSDPAAVGFYEAMGARIEKKVEVSPGFFISVYWFDLSSST